MLKYLGVAYLAYMAWATWRDQGALSLDGHQPQRRVGQVLFSGITINLLNPKLTLFFFASSRSSCPRTSPTPCCTCWV